MVDFLTNLWNAWLQRMRAPFIGSITLSFIAINWQPIWYLLFTNEPVSRKFSYFNLHTSLSTLIIDPVIIGMSLALASPWLRLVGTWWTQLPTLRLKKIQANREHDIKIHHEYLKRDQIFAIKKRVEAETKRDEAEAARVEAETKRAEAETERAEAEAARVEADTKRAGAEHDQVEAILQAKRIEAEANRQPRPPHPDDKGLTPAQQTKEIKAEAGLWPRF